MGRIVYLAVFVAILGGCVPVASDQVRDEFGLSTARLDGGAAAAAAPEVAKLNWKASQLCIHGYTQTQQTIEPAEAGKQLIDMKLVCGHYDRWDFDYTHVNWANLL